MEQNQKSISISISISINKYKIRFNSDGDFPPNKPLKIFDVIIVVRSFFHEGNSKV